MIKMKHKMQLGKSKKGIMAVSQIFTLVLAVFAFCFIIWEGERGRGYAVGTSVINSEGIKYTKSATGSWLSKTPGTSTLYDAGVDRLLADSSSGYRIITVGRPVDSAGNLVNMGSSCLTSQTQILLPELKDGTKLTNEELSKINFGERERERDENKMNKKAVISYTQIGMIILGIFSFAYLIGDLPSVRSLGTSSPALGQVWQLNNGKLIKISEISGGQVRWTGITDPGSVGNIPSSQLNPGGGYTFIGDKPSILPACLTSQTQILLPELKTKPISEIKTGDEVLSYDFETGKLTKEIVQNVIVSEKYEYLKINNVLEITPNHEVLLNNEWKKIGDAKIGDELFGADRNKIKIKSIEKISKREGIKVYDLDLGGKWYFAEGVLVHNSQTGAPAPTSGTQLFVKGTGDRVFTQSVKDVVIKDSHGKVLFNDKISAGSKLIKNQDGTYNLFKPGQTNAVVENIPADQIGSLSGSIAPTTGGSTGATKAITQYTDWKIVTGSGADALISGLWWAGIAYGIGYMIGSLTGMSDKETQALSTALAAGSFVGKALYTYSGNYWGIVNSNSWFAGKAWASGAVGLTVAFLVYAYMYEKTEQKVVEFQCLPWQAPKGGADCEKCNKDKMNPCSEYRCKSLGKLCELENKGTDKEMCMAVDLRETDPPIIKPNSMDLTKGYNFIYPDTQTSPPSHGFRIVPNVGGECIKPFTPIKFGISTYHPNGETVASRCKIDVKHTKSFDEMAYWMGGSNLYDFNHTDFFSLPGPQEFANTSLQLENGKTMVFYIRCEGKNDKPNVNPAEYMLRFCVDPSPDTTYPEVKATSILTDSCVAENQNSGIVEFYTNEPAECRWGKENRNFEELTNSMRCPTSAVQMNELMLYTCRANLTGIARTNTKFYVKCKDHPELAGKNESLRNKMSRPYEFTLRSSDGLRINKIQPTGTIYSGLSTASINLYVETSSGCEDGKARCFYSSTGNNNDYIEFFETNTEDGVHQSQIFTTEGRHAYFIKCVDAGGNVAVNSTSVNVEVLKDGPVVARAYASGDNLRIVTLRNSECAYTFDNCDFAFKEGIPMPVPNETIHYADLRMDKTYYIKCRDVYTTEGAGCSIILKPQQLMESVSLS